VHHCVSVFELAQVRFVFSIPLNRHFTFCVPFQIEFGRLKVLGSTGMTMFVVRVEKLYIVIGGCHISEDSIL